MSIQQEEYTTDYYTHHAEGHDEFEKSGGKVLPSRLHIPLTLGDIQSGMLVIDIGCGRGEIIYHAARLGARVWGTDYAVAAVRLSKKTIQNLKKDHEGITAAVQLSDAMYLPFPPGCADVVFLLDIVEHIAHHDLKTVFKEVYRVLSPDGRLVIHTMPNLWYYHYGYPLFRFVQRLRGKRLPNNPRDRWAYAHVHINEQTPRKLGKMLRATGFKYRLWLQSTQTHQEESSSFVRSMMTFLTKFIFTKYIFCNDIFAVGHK